MSHYFSLARLLARPRDSELLRMLSRHQEVYRDHALVWRLFPGDGLPRDFVFRQEVDDSGTLFYYIVSHREPRDVDGLFDIRTKPYTPNPPVGVRLRFDLRANPTVSRRDQAGVSRRHDVLMDAKRKLGVAGDAGGAMHTAAADWLSRRASHWGLSLDGDALQNAYHQHRLVPKRKRIEFSSLDYRGHAHVADQALLRRALLDGVGHARGFGCGLLMVRRTD